MSKGRARHMFPGGNTHLGFFSYYDHILSQEEAEKIYVIKGGPGAGKSTFMKRLGEEMLNRGHDMEFMHCSSDSDSLDGIVIRDLKMAVLDGTAPHVVDPKHPGAVDEIINFGDFWDEASIKKHKKEILIEGEEISSLFARAYRYLHAAHHIYQDSASIFGRFLNRGKLNRVISQLESKLFRDRNVEIQVGQERSLFASAITPAGYVNYLDSLLDVGTVYEIRGDMGTGEELILESIKGRALSNGWDVEGFYCALNPHRLEHLVITGMDTAITTSNAYHQSQIGTNHTIDMMDYIDRGLVERYRGQLDENRHAFDQLMDVALANIKRAKENHDRLEQYYIPYIDFKAMDARYEEILERILSC